MWTTNILRRIVLKEKDSLNKKNIQLLDGVAADSKKKQQFICINYM